MPLSNVNIESELSYAYLHAIAGKAGMSCKIGDRHDDAAGVDVEVIFRGKTSHSYITQVQFNVQLKATIKPEGNIDDYVTYFLQGVTRYDKLRTKDGVNYKILIVLFLPNDSNDWLTYKPEELIMKKSAYWVSLYGAPASKNGTGETIYIPKANLLTPEELVKLVDLAANEKIPAYTIPTNE